MIDDMESYLQESIVINKRTIAENTPGVENSSLQVITPVYKIKPVANYNEFETASLQKKFFSSMVNVKGVNVKYGDVFYFYDGKHWVRIGEFIKLRLMQIDSKYFISESKDPTLYFRYYTPSCLNTNILVIALNKVSDALSNSKKYIEKIANNEMCISYMIDNMLTDVRSFKCDIGYYQLFNSTNGIMKLIERYDKFIRENPEFSNNVKKKYKEIYMLSKLLRSSFNILTSTQRFKLEEDKITNEKYITRNIDIISRIKTILSIIIKNKNIIFEKNESIINPAPNVVLGKLIPLLEKCKIIIEQLFASIDQFITYYNYHHKEDRFKPNNELSLVSDVDGDQVKIESTSKEVDTKIRVSENYAKIVHDKLDRVKKVHVFNGIIEKYNDVIEKNCGENQNCVNIFNDVIAEISTILKVIKVHDPTYSCKYTDLHKLSRVDINENKYKPTHKPTGGRKTLRKRKTLITTSRKLKKPIKQTKHNKRRTAFRNKRKRSVKINKK